MKTKPLFAFNGNAQDALDFYTNVFNGTVTAMCRYGDYQAMEVPDDYKQKIIHSDLEFNGVVISIADTMPDTKTDFGYLGHITTIFCDTEQQIKDVYNKLSQGGEVKCPLGATPYAKQYAEVLDKFGVYWALIIE